MSTYRIDGVIVKTENALAHWEESTHWDGRNHISNATGSQWNHQTLYQSRKDRYWLESTSQWQGSTPTAEFVSNFLTLLMERLEEEHEALALEGVSGFAADLLRQAALDEVNWREIAETYLEGVERSDYEGHASGCVCADCSDASLTSPND